MIQQRIDRLFTSLATISPSGVPFNAQERLIVSSGLLYISIGYLWGAMFFLYEEYLTGAIPFSYGIFMSFFLPYFLRTRNADLFMRFQIPLTLLLPFLVQVAIGGFVNASAAVLFSFTAPMIALVVLGPKAAIRWFWAFILIIVISGLIDPVIQRETNLSPNFGLILFVLNSLGVLGVSFIVLYYFVHQRNTAYGLLHDEQQRSESLLLNILPKEIAELLKVEEQTIATQFDEASVLFADIVGFTPLSEQLTPKEMVELLNDIFSHFDGLVKKYKVEKIRTVGDNYMVASGVPTPRSDHAAVLADLALEMKSYIDNLDAINGKKINFRIGINCGKMIGGIIGTHKFHYDVWGDSVNIASRMESHSVPGKIQVSNDYYQLISDRFELEKRGTIVVKGKGEMETWFLISKKG